MKVSAFIAASILVFSASAASSEHSEGTGDFDIRASASPSSKLASHLVPEVRAKTSHKGNNGKDGNKGPCKGKRASSGSPANCVYEGPLFPDGACTYTDGSGNPTTLHCDPSTPCPRDPTERKGCGPMGNGKANCQRPDTSSC